MGRAAAECFAVESARVGVVARTNGDLVATVGRLKELGPGISPPTTLVFFSRLSDYCIH